MKPKDIAISLSIAVIVVAFSSLFLYNGITGFAVGVPPRCIAHLSIDSPSAVEIQPGGFDEIEVTLYNVSCGISYVRLELLNVPSEYYSVSPSFIASIAPTESKNFTLHFDIPVSADTVTYGGEYRIYTNEGRFTYGALELDIVEPEKPRASAQVSSRIETASGKIETRWSENIKFWWIVSLSAVVLAIILIGSEYFKSVIGEPEPKRRFKPKTTKRMRTVLEVYKTEKAKPKPKKKFSKVLKKSKK